MPKKNGLLNLLEEAAKQKQELPDTDAEEYLIVDQYLTRRSKKKS